MDSLTPTTLLPPPPHVLVFPFPLLGHLNPLMQLSKLLASHRFSVTFVTTHYRLAAISRARNALPVPPLASPIRLEGLSDGLPPDHDRDPLSLEFCSAVDALGNELDHLLHRLSQEQTPVTCIISDSFLPWSQDIADKWGIPRVVFWTQSAAVFASYASIARLVANGYDPFDKEDETRSAMEINELITCIPGLPPMRPSELPFHWGGGTRIRWNTWLSDILIVQFRRLREAICVIGNSFDELESNVIQALDLGVPICFMGPLLPFIYLDEDHRSDVRTGVSLWEEDECLLWLDKQAPSSVLYISFGSIVTLSNAQVEEIAMGLAATRQPFLWVLRLENVLEVLPRGFQDSAIEQGRVIRWAPQSLVLSHSAVGGFLTHCGWNATLESVSMGVPVLAFPEYLDHFTNCKFLVQEWKLGLELKRRDGDLLLDRKELEQGVRIVMQGEEGREMRRTGAKLRDAARRAMNMELGGTSATHLHAFVEDIVRRSQLVAAQV